MRVPSSDLQLYTTSDSDTWLPSIVWSRTEDDVIRTPPTVSNYRRLLVLQLDSEDQYVLLMFYAALHRGRPH